MPTTPPTPNPSAPPAPLRSEGAPTFSSKMEAFLLWLSGFHTYLTNLAPWVKSTADEVNTSATAATAAANSAYQTAGAAPWVSGATYQAGVCAIDTTDWMTYRRKVTGAGTTRPGLDSTNWIVLSAVSDSSVTVAKLSADFILPVADGGTGASTAAAARTNLDVPTRTGTDASGTWGISVTGNSATATKLATARLIGGVSFDGTANINLPGVNATGNQNTTGNAATASSVAWTGVTGRPTALSQFTNDLGFINSGGVNTNTVLAALAGAAVGAVGTYAIMSTYMQVTVYLQPGATRAGAFLIFDDVQGNGFGSFPQGEGTWRLMGAMRGYVTPGGVYVGLWLRIA